MPNTGSDTRMYAPRSESNLGYTKDDEDYTHGIGDAKSMEEYRDKRMAEKDAEVDSSSLPHLKLEVPKPEPEMPSMPSMPSMPEDEPVMDDDNENAVGAEVSQMTGMPDTGNLSIGNAIGTKPDAGGQLVNMSEPMSDAWSSLLKSRLDNVRGSSVTPWKQPQFKIQPGGSDITTGTSRRAKLYSRHLQPEKHRGIDRAPLSVHRTHLGVATKQPLKLFPQKYRQQMGSMQRRKWQGNVPSSPAGHAMGAETTYSPKTPKVASSEGLKITSPTGPKLMGQSFAKSESISEVRKELDSVSKKMDYMHFAQMRRLLRRIKDSMENRERRLKAASSGGPGANREVGHREGHKTTKPEGATENLEDDPKNWGAPATLFAARGSGRVG